MDPGFTTGKRPDQDAFGRDPARADFIGPDEKALSREDFERRMIEMQMPHPTLYLSIAVMFAARAIGDLANEVRRAGERLERPRR